MEFKVQIRQLGKIGEAIFDIKPLTIIAGENGSGKSFATKSLYSLLEALNRDHVSILLENAIRNISNSAEFFKTSMRTPSAVDKEFYEQLAGEIIPTLESVLARSQEAGFQLQEGMASNALASISKISESVSSYVRQRDGVKRMERPLEIIKAIQSQLNIIELALNDHSGTFTKGIADGLEDNFKKNFQVTDLKVMLASGGNEEASIHIDGIGGMSIGRQGRIGFTFEALGISEVQRLDHIIFIDSPVYLKIRKGLERQAFGLYARRFQRYLKGYPQHVDDLYRYLDSEYIDIPDFSELSQELQELLVGRLVVSKSGDIEYQEQDGRKHPLSLTAMGVSNIGLIELLIRNNIIKKGSFLIIDEPEAHLHPKWQVVLMEVLYKIARAGANVIVATHSIDMIKKIELLLNKDEDAAKYISLNRTPFSREDADRTEAEKAELILQQLSSPFYDMYMDGL